MYNFNLAENMQSAYKPAHSTETALFRVKNDILCELGKQNGVFLVMLDLSAAFDTVDHQILLQRLNEEIGLTGTALEWFRSYLHSPTKVNETNPAPPINVGSKF